MGLSNLQVEGKALHPFSDYMELLSLKKEHMNLGLVVTERKFPLIKAANVVDE